MAKRGKATVKGIGAKSYRMCRREDGNCPAAHALPTVKLAVRPGFSYTSGAAVPPRGAKERRAHGCEESTSGKYKKFTGRLKDGTPDSFCKVTDPPCGEPRVGCPVQLVFINGQPNLRFCETLKQPGYLVPVNSPEEADALAREACAKWPNKLKKTVEWPDEFFQQNAPEVVVEKARKAHPKSPWGTPGLGEDDTGSVAWMAEAARESLQSRSDDAFAGWPKKPIGSRRQRPSRPSNGGRAALWLLGGTAAGLLFIKMTKGGSDVRT